MFSSCQHKLCFSRTSWYSSAIKAIIPAFKIPLNFSQVRFSATLLDTSSFDNPLPHPKTRSSKPKTITQLLESNTKISRRKGAITVRCAAFKKVDGEPCKRNVLIYPSKIHQKVYCYHHNTEEISKAHPSKSDIFHVKPEQVIKIKQTMETNELQHTPKKNLKIYDCWDLLIKPEMGKRYKKLIKEEMIKPVSERDGPSYIYAYALDKGPRIPREKYAYFKIGRTGHPHRRMYQVSNSCSFVPKIIELFPSFPLNLNGDRMSTNLETLEEKALEKLPKCPLSHRVERLIHLELKSFHNSGGFKCSTCGTTHREWFKIKRSLNSNNEFMTDQEIFESSIRPVILKWIQYGVITSALNKLNYSIKNK